MTRCPGGDIDEIRRTSGRRAHLFVGAGLALLLAVGAVFTPGSGLAPATTPPAEWGVPATTRVVEAPDAEREAFERLQRLLLVLGVSAAGVVLLTGLALEVGGGEGERFPVAVRASLGAPPRRILAYLARRRLRPLLARGVVGGAVSGAVLALLLLATWPGEGSSWGRGGWPIGGMHPVAASAWVALAVVAGALSLGPFRWAFRALSRTLAAGSGDDDPFVGSGRRAVSVLQMAVGVGIVAGAAGVVPDAFDPGNPTGDPIGKASTVEAVLVPVRISPESTETERRARWAEILERAERTGTFSAESIATPGAWLGSGRRDLVVAECGACVRGGLPVPMLGEVVRQHVVSPGFFEHGPVRILDGRAFTPEDGPGSEPVAIVSLSFARRSFEDGDPLGRRLRVGRGAGSWHTVVGVVDEPRVIGPGRSPGGDPAVYLSLLQHPPDRGDLALTPVEPDGWDGAAPDVTEAGALSAGPPRSLRELRRRTAAPVRWAGAVSGLLGLAALAGTLVGTAAVIRVEVRGRRRSMAVRTALGAPKRALVRWVLARTLRAVSWGALLGVPVAVGVGGAIRASGGAVPLFDPVLFGFVVAAAAGAAVIGAVGPAREVAALDPAPVLAGE